MTDGCQNEIFKFCLECGHIEQEHSNDYDFPMCSICANLSDFKRDWRHPFVLDNLKYLQDKYEKKQGQSNPLPLRLRDL